MSSRNGKNADKKVPLPKRRGSGTRGTRLQPASEVIFEYQREFPAVIAGQVYPRPYRLVADGPSPRGQGGGDAFAVDQNDLIAGRKPRPFGRTAACDVKNVQLIAAHNRVEAGPVPGKGAIDRRLVRNQRDRSVGKVDLRARHFYLWGDASIGVPTTPVTLKAHLGYSNGNPGLGPNGTSIAPTGKYLDWMLGAGLALGPVILGISYVDTDISRSESPYLQPGFSSSKNGSSIANGTVLFSLTASF